LVPISSGRLEGATEPAIDRCRRANVERAPPPAAFDLAFFVLA